MVSKEYLRRIPAVDKVLLWPEMRELKSEYSHRLLVEAIRDSINSLREKIISSVSKEELSLERDVLLQNIKQILLAKQEKSLKKVVNATGIVLHTNLGRAPLSEAAIEHLCQIARNYSTLEIDAETGNRGSRYQHVEQLLCQLTGAESALVVNNNAAAILLALSTLAQGKEVIISRGQLVEIGGSFRIPEVMEQSQAKLVEVGATNKTYLSDYEKAINDSTALLLQVHTSNYRIVGFTAEVGLSELVLLGEKYNLPILDDLGSGVLLEMSDEPTVRQRIKAGVDIVTFSGDKLLGGPQCGIIVGKAEYIARMKKNPLTRALRIDKLNLAVLESTLRIYLEPEKVKEEIPIWAMLSLPLLDLQKKAKKLASLLRKELKEYAIISTEKGISKAGGGSLPLHDFPTMLVTCQFLQGKPEEWSQFLRLSNPPIFTRINREKLIFDVRTLFKEDYQIIRQAMLEIKKRWKK